MTFPTPRLTVSQHQTRFRRAVVVAMVALLTVTLASPVDAKESLSSQRNRRTGLRTQKAKLAAQLNTLKASDRELEAAVKDLGAHAKATQAAASSARRAVEAARQAVATAEAQLAETEQNIAQMETEVKARAVANFIRPQGDLLGSLATSTDLNEATRRTALIAQVADRGRTVVDQLGAAREDHEVQRGAAQAARQAADSRRAAADKKAAEASEALLVQARAKAALEGRIGDYQRLMDEMARSDASLSALIRQSEAAGTSVVSGAVSGRGLMWPNGGRVTSEYGQRWGRLHSGIDIANRTGSPIVAAAAGQVIFSGTQGGYGRTVVISHGGGLSTLYAHQSSLAVSSGTNVSRGQTVGYVGNTGNSTGPHLHFETRVNGSPQNPRRYLP